MSDKDPSSIRLPLSWKPGSDLMSTLLLNDPMIVNLVVQSLLGKDIPADSYKVAPNDDSRFTPMIINIQEVVDSDSMSNSSDRFDHSFKSINKEELDISEDSFLIPLKSAFWAYKYFLFSPSGISSLDGRSKPTMLVALCQLISSPSKTLSLYEAQSHSICFVCETKSYDDEE
ncbi:hypothetical protein INT47_007094 [Mucor saturninus]|uniref:Uncharacterized protein n=1 Tax=Mucor saturninus TaxID=64648 RepID=A0A8H7QQS6_9FUNG|nr:hypothetical protein INT47_007094 [Mucor saturninus]